jgi:hypothetical protein
VPTVGNELAVCVARFTHAINSRCVCTFPGQDPSEPNSSICTGAGTEAVVRPGTLVLVITPGGAARTAMVCVEAEPAVISVVSAVGTVSVTGATCARLTSDVVRNSSKRCLIIGLHSHKLVNNSYFFRTNFGSGGDYLPVRLHATVLRDLWAD